MVVDVVLPAVLGLVHVGETGISACASTRVSDMCAYITKGISAKRVLRRRAKLKLFQAAGK